MFFRKRKTTATITASLTNMANDLREHSAARQSECDDIDKQIDTLELQRQEAVADAGRAAKVAMSLEDLLN